MVNLNREFSQLVNIVYRFPNNLNSQLRTQGENISRTLSQIQVPSVSQVVSRMFGQEISGSTASLNQFNQILNETGLSAERVRRDLTNLQVGLPSESNLDFGVLRRLVSEISNLGRIAPRNIDLIRNRLEELRPQFIALGISSQEFDTRLRRATSNGVFNIRALGREFARLQSFSDRFPNNFFDFFRFQGVARALRNINNVITTRFLRPVITSYLDITGRTTEFGQSVNRITGSFNALRFAIASAFENPLIVNTITNLSNFIQNVSDEIQDNEILQTGLLIAIPVSIGLGLIQGALSTLALLGQIRNLIGTSSIGNAFTSGTGGTIGTLALSGLALAGGVGLSISLAVQDIDFEDQTSPSRLLRNLGAAVLTGLGVAGIVSSVGTPVAGAVAGIGAFTLNVLINFITEAQNIENLRNSVDNSLRRINLSVEDLGINADTLSNLASDSTSNSFIREQARELGNLLQQYDELGEQIVRNRALGNEEGASEGITNQAELLQDILNLDERLNDSLQNQDINFNEERLRDNFAKAGQTALESFTSEVDSGVGGNPLGRIFGFLPTMISDLFQNIENSDLVSFDLSTTLENLFKPKDVATNITDTVNTTLTAGLKDQNLNIKITYTEDRDSLTSAGRRALEGANISASDFSTIEDR